MNAFSRIFIFSISIFLPFNSYSQEWLVEMNPQDGTFEAVGPSIEGVYTIFGGLQCKDEVNGQYIFMKADAANSFASVDISNAQIIADTPMPAGLSTLVQGFHCYGNCDTLILNCLDYGSNRSYVALFDRFNGTELNLLDSMPLGNPDPFISANVINAFDPVNNLLYLYSPSTSLLHVMQIPSGDILNSYSADLMQVQLAFDEVNNELYAMEFIGSSTYRLLVFVAATGDFVQIGDSFTMTGSYYTATIDGNNHRMLATGHSAFIGSYLASIDLITGELLVNVQTVLPDGGAFGGTNAINGQYFNSTDQLITLHWGTGSTVTSVNKSEAPESKAWIYPNPSQGAFNIHIDENVNEVYRLKIVNLNGQIIYENNNLRSDQSLDLSLPAGYFIANVFNSDGLLFESIPLLIAADK